MSEGVHHGLVYYSIALIVTPQSGECKYDGDEILGC